MTDLERTLQTLVDDPVAPPTDVALLERRAGRIRRSRQLATGAGALALIAVVGLSAATVLDRPPTGPPVIGEPTDETPTEPGGTEPEATETAPPATDDPTDAPTAAEEPTATEQPTDTPTSSEEPAGANTDPDNWLTIDEVRDWQAANGSDGFWVPVRFLPADWFERPDAYEMSPGALETRWLLVGTEGDDDREQFVRATFAAMAGANPPDGLINAFGPDTVIEVERFEMSDVGVYDDPAGRVMVVFTDPLLETARSGSTGAIAMQLQMAAVMRHVFPEAAEGCIATTSTADDPESTIGFHDMELCPFPLYP